MEEKKETRCWHLPDILKILAFSAILGMGYLVPLCVPYLIITGWQNRTSTIGTTMAELVIATGWQTVVLSLGTLLILLGFVSIFLWAIVKIVKED